MKHIGMAEVAAHIVDWSYRDPEGEPVPPSLAILEKFDPDDYRELERAVQAHIKKCEEERAASKNARATVTETDAGMTSVSVA